MMLSPNHVLSSMGAGGFTGAALILMAYAAGLVSSKSTTRHTIFCMTSCLILTLLTAIIFSPSPLPFSLTSMTIVLSMAHAIRREDQHHNH